jgi:hypothetical protein
MVLPFRELGAVVRPKTVPDPETTSEAFLTLSRETVPEDYSNSIAAASKTQAPASPPP